MLLVFKGVDGQGVSAKDSEPSEQTILKKDDQKIVLKKDDQEKENENIKQELKTQLVSFRAVSVKYDPLILATLHQATEHFAIFAQKLLPTNTS